MPKQLPQFILTQRHLAIPRHLRNSANQNFCGNAQMLGGGPFIRIKQREKDASKKGHRTGRTKMNKFGTKKSPSKKGVQIFHASPPPLLHSFQSAMAQEKPTFVLPPVSNYQQKEGTRKALPKQVNCWRWPDFWQPSAANKGHWMDANEETSKVYNPHPIVHFHPPKQWTEKQNKKDQW